MYLNLDFIIYKNPILNSIYFVLEKQNYKWNMIIK